MPTRQQLQQQLFTPSLPAANISYSYCTIWGPAALGPPTTPFSTLAYANITAADRRVAWVFPVPQTGNITKFSMNVGLVQGSPPNYYIGLVTTSSYIPTTTAYGGSAVYDYAPTTAGWKTLTLGTPAAATAGDYVAWQIWPNGTPNGTNYLRVTYDGPNNYLGHGALYQNSTWSYYNPTPMMSFEYDTGEVYGYSLSSDTIYYTMASGSNPNEVGSLFTLPVRMTTYGARFVNYYGGWGASATADYYLYDQNDNILASALAVNNRVAFYNNNFCDVTWPAVTLNPNTPYRLTVKALNSSPGGNTPFLKTSFNSEAVMQNVPFGPTWKWTYRTSGGAWTDDFTAMSVEGLIVDSIELANAFA